jgi:hypothetical protein
VEIGIPVERRLVLLVRNESQILGDQLVIDLHFQLFIEAVLPIRLNPGLCAVVTHPHILQAIGERGHPIHLLL